MTSAERNKRIAAVRVRLMECERVHAELLAQRAALDPDRDTRRQEEIIGLALNLTTVRRTRLQQSLARLEVER